MLWFSVKIKLFWKQKGREIEEPDENLIHVMQTFLI